MVSIAVENEAVLKFELGCLPIELDGEKMMGGDNVRIRREVFEL